MTSAASPVGAEAPTKKPETVKNQVCNLWQVPAALTLDPQPIITVKCGDQEWLVHQNILIHGSDYFKTALTKPFAENSTHIIRLEVGIITTQNLGHYISIAYQAALCSTFKVCSENMPESDRLAKSIKLWTAADYFQNAAIKREASKSVDAILHARLKSLSNRAFQSKDEAARHLAVQVFCHGWDACQDVLPAITQFRSSLAYTFAKGCGHEALKILWETASEDMSRAVSEELLKMRK
ncbi:hypothetical protein VDGL01_07376 [Verticillium dahliae]